MVVRRMTAPAAHLSPKRKIWILRCERLLSSLRLSWRMAAPIFRQRQEWVDTDRSATSAGLALVCQQNEVSKGSAAMLRHDRLNLDAGSFGASERAAAPAPCESWMRKEIQ